jgi:hypothetical protein
MDKWTKLTRIKGANGGVHLYCPGSVLVPALHQAGIETNCPKLEMRPDFPVGDSKVRIASITIFIRKKED